MLRILALALLGAFLCGCGKTNGQGAQTGSNKTTAVTDAKDGSTNDGQFAPTFTLPHTFQPAPPRPATNEASSKAISRLPDGTVYEGDFRDGKANGQGTLTDPRGTNQQGEWRNGRLYKVRGTWVAPDGTKEVGSWNKDGSRSGGTITWKDGREYKGDWKVVEGAPDLPDGVGEMTWPDGRKYIGQFHDGTMDGPGKMTYRDGKVEEGSWKDGKFAGPAQ